MTNDDRLIYILVSCVFHIVHFRHFDGQKMRFLLIRQRVLLSQCIWIYVFGIELSANTSTLLF